ncbi:MAG TPA: helix-turn-helix transcriptional regulator [Vitreimonas sp.]|nr:helix-turn-helix transcriptional regulator [Vitreimonas sp.]
MPSSTLRVNGSRIREARLSAGMSQSQLARQVGTSERNIVRWENSKNQPRVESVAAIAEATGRDVDFFLSVNGASGDEDEEESEAVTLDDFLRLRIRQLLREEAAAL